MSARYRCGRTLAGFYHRLGAAIRIVTIENPSVRWSIGLGGAAVIALIALTLLEGTLQLVVLGIAAVDAVTTPWLLKQTTR